MKKRCKAEASAKSEEKRVLGAREKESFKEDKLSKKSKGTGNNGGRGGHPLVTET